MYLCAHLTHKEGTMQNLRKFTVIGILFVSVAGTLLHFVYDWSGQNPLVGFFAPVNESTWEHMKLLLFPMLLYGLIAREPG